MSASNPSLTAFGADDDVEMSAPTHEWIQGRAIALKATFSVSLTKANTFKILFS
jgi:hypothetical protein